MREMDHTRRNKCCKQLNQHEMPVFIFSALNLIHLTKSRVPSTVHCPLFTVHCSLSTVHCSLSTVHCPLFTVHCTYVLVPRASPRISFSVISRRPRRIV